VAYIGDQIVGSVSIVDNDMPGLDLGFTPGPLPPGPWLSTLFVVPEFRRQGIATFLITYCKDYLSSMGYTEAYLFAEKPGLEYSLYGPLGWEIIKRVDYKHYKDLAVMKIKI
jgi:GNAT superfamily N-acetyltransferase